MEPLSSPLFQAFLSLLPQYCFRCLPHHFSPNYCTLATYSLSSLGSQSDLPKPHIWIYYFPVQRSSRLTITREWSWYNEQSCLWSISASLSGFSCCSPALALYQPYQTMKLLDKKYSQTSIISYGSTYYQPFRKRPCLFPLPRRLFPLSFPPFIIHSFIP